MIENISHLSDIWIECGDNFRVGRNVIGEHFQLNQIKSVSKFFSQPAAEIV